MCSVYPVVVEQLKKNKVRVGNWMKIILLQSTEQDTDTRLLFYSDQNLNSFLWVSRQTR